MRKEIVETKIMQTIGAYTIVKSVEQAYWDDGRRAGRVHNWYDICLDGGKGDIVASYDKLNDARMWIKMNGNGKVIHEFYYVVGHKDFASHYTLKVNRETGKMLYGHVFNDREEKCDNFAVNKRKLNDVMSLVDRKYGLVYKIQIEENTKEAARIQAKNIIYNYLLKIAENFMTHEGEN